MFRLVKKYLDKFNKLSPVAKSSFALIFAKFFQRGMSLVSGPIFVRIMPQTEYGIISTFTSWQSVLYIIATLNMAQGVFNNGMIDYKNDREHFTFSIMCLANICTFLLLSIYFVGYRWLNPFIDMPPVLMVVMFLYFFFTPAYNYWMGRQRFEYKYKAITVVMVGSSIISTIIAIVAVLLSRDDQKAIVKVVSTESVSIAIGIVITIYTLFKAKGKINTQYWKYALAFNLPLVPHYLSMYILSSSDRIMITRFVGTAQTAIYNVAYTVASIMLIFWNSVDATYAPWIYQHMEKGIEVSEAEKRIPFHPVKGFVIGFAGSALFLILAVILAVTAQRQMTGAGVLPSWLDSYMRRSEINGALAQYTQSGSVYFADIIRIVVRILIMPFISLAGAENRTLLLTIERLSPLFVLIPAISYGSGYLLGTSRRTKVHSEIAENRRRRVSRERREKKTRISHAPKGPEQLN